MAQPIHGVLEVQSQQEHATRILLDPDTATIAAGGNGAGGDLVLKDATGGEVARLDSQGGGLRIGATGSPGYIDVRDNAGTIVFFLDGSAGEFRIGTNGNDGDMYVRDGAGRNVFHFDGSVAALRVGASGNAGDIVVRDGAGAEAFHLDGNTAAIYIGANGKEGDIIVRDGVGRNVLHFNGHNAALYVGANGNEGDIIVRNGSGSETIRLDGGSGDVILSNADCAEDFDVAPLVAVEPGTVMVLDPDGALRPSTGAYEKTVMGVVSGAGEYKSGIVLDRRRSDTHRIPLGLVGKVFCKVDAQYGPIQPGDLLTTSPTPGYAMKASDPDRAFGTVIGKAMRGLPGGQGLIPILIALQ